MKDVELIKQIEEFKVVSNVLTAKVDAVDQTNLDADSIASIEFIKKALSQELEYFEKSLKIEDLMGLIELDSQYEMQYDLIIAHAYKLAQRGIIS